MHRQYKTAGFYSILQADGRIAAVELAGAYGLSPTCTANGLEATASGRALSRGTGRGSIRTGSVSSAFWCSSRCCSTKTTPDIFDRFAKAVRAAPEVLECHTVAGGFDYLIKTAPLDMALAYRRFLGDVLLALPGVRETRTYAVMEEVKRDGALPV